MKHLFALAILLVPAAVSAAEASSVSVLAGPCAACHGPDGEGSGAIPKIQGRPADVLLDQLVRFRDGKEESTVMGRLARGYSPEQLRQLADHFGAK